jgi:hypothetical protein
MVNHGEMRAEFDPQRLLVLQDEDTVRLNLPPLPVDGRAEPLHLHLDLNVESVELAIERLVELRKQMKPAPA